MTILKKRVSEKVLHSLPAKCNHFVVAIEESQDDVSKMITFELMRSVPSSWIKLDEQVSKSICGVSFKRSSTKPVIKQGVFS